MLFPFCVCVSKREFATLLYMNDSEYIVYILSFYFLWIYIALHLHYTFIKRLIFNAYFFYLKLHCYVVGDVVSVQ